MSQTALSLISEFQTLADVVVTATKNKMDVLTRMNNAVVYFDSSWEGTDAEAHFDAEVAADKIYQGGDELGYISYYEQHAKLMEFVVEEVKAKEALQSFIRSLNIHGIDEVNMLLSELAIRVGKIITDEVGNA
jgi:hypothetical protein